MEDNKKSSYNGYTNARKEANKRYMENFVEIKVRTKLEDRDKIKSHAASMGESTNAFINRAITETMERDTSNQQEPHSPSADLHRDTPPTDPQPTPREPAQQITKPARGKQDKHYKPFTEDEAQKIDLLELLSNIRYQLDISETFGMDVLAALLNKARQQASDEDSE